MNRRTPTQSADADRWTALIDEATRVAPGPNEASRIGATMRRLGKRQSQSLGRRLAMISTKVRGGPFAGMDLLPDGPPEGAFPPRLLGCYEAELHGVIERIVESEPPVIYNVGCSDGYYAVGLSRRLPGALVYAFDRDGDARSACERAAACNGVSDRVRLHGEFDPASVVVPPGGHWCIVMDVEGAEEALLRIQECPSLASASIVVECHDCFVPGVSSRLSSAFSSTHFVERYESSGPRGAVCSVSGAALSSMDTLIAQWEWRTGPTPWLFMLPKPSFARAASRSRTLLNVGSGSATARIPAEYDSWEVRRLDIDSRCSPTIRADGTSLQRLDGERYDAVYCSHNLEHYHRHQIPQVLDGMRHVLRPGGFVHIRVPDVVAVLERAWAGALDLRTTLYVSPAGPVSVADVLYGFSAEIERSGADYYAHKWGFSAVELQRDLKHAGFRHVTVVRSNLELIAYAQR